MKTNITTIIKTIQADLKRKILVQENLIEKGEIKNKDLKQYHLGRLDAIREILDSTQKTNKQWYFYEEQGASFKLFHGVLLMYAPQDDNDMPNEENATIIPEEEWYENEPMTRDQMIKDLEGKE